MKPFMTLMERQMSTTNADIPENPRWMQSAPRLGRRPIGRYYGTNYDNSVIGYYLRDSRVIACSMAVENTGHHAPFS